MMMMTLIIIHDKVTMTKRMRMSERLLASAHIYPYFGDITGSSV